MQMGQLTTLGIIGIFVAKNQHLMGKTPTGVGIAKCVPAHSIKSSIVFEFVNHQQN